MTPPRSRRLLALAGLLVLALLLVLGSAGRTGPGPVGAGRTAPWLLALPIPIAVLGLIRSRDWGGWLTLAIGLATLPWATVLAFLTGPGTLAGAGRFALAATAAILMGAAGAGPVRLQTTATEDEFSPAVDTESSRSRPQRARERWLRWTIIGCMTSALNLFAFVVAYSFRNPADSAGMGAMLLGLMAGAWLLARHRTAGLPLIWLCCALLIPTGTWFVMREASGPGEAILFAVLFAPGLVAGLVTVLLFGRPVLTVFHNR